MYKRININYLIITIVVGILVLLNQNLFSQNRNDSLKQLLTQDIPDSMYLRIVNELYSDIEYRNMKMMIQHLNKAIKIAKNNNSTLNISRLQLTLGKIYLYKSQYFISISHLKKALKAVKTEQKTKDTLHRKLLANIYLNFGNAYFYLGQYSKSNEFYFHSLSISETLNDTLAIIKCSSNLGGNFNELNDSKNAIKYSLMAYELGRNFSDLSPTFNSVNILGDAYFSLKNYTKAYDYYKESIEIQKNGKIDENIFSHIGLVNVFGKWHQYDSALWHYQKAYEIATLSNNTDFLMRTYYAKGSLYLEKEEFHQAETFYRKSLQLAKASNASHFLLKVIEQLSIIFEKEGDLSKAFGFYKNGMKIRDSLFDMQKNEQLKEIEIKYESEQKERTIDLLSKENRINKLEIEKENSKFILSLFSAILIIITLLFIFIYYRKRQKIKQIISVQKMERKVLSSIVETEDKERKRFAEDIHDEVNPLLSSIKLYLGEIKYTEGEEKIQMLDYANELTTEAINQVRKISHNIMPTSLSDKGLVTSLQEFAQKIKFSKNLDVNIENKLNDKRYNRNLELVLFRIIKELINNTLKHAKASMITILLKEEKHHIWVFYEDNGVGFDVKEIKNTQDKGIGLSNIESRINSINGSCKIESKKGKGVKIQIQIPL